MKYSDFRHRFYAAVEDFSHQRKIKDELAAYAAVNVHGLAQERSWPTQVVVHQVMLVGAYPELRVTACMNAYRQVIPWLTRVRLAVGQWHERLADPPDNLPDLRPHDPE